MFSFFPYLSAKKGNSVFSRSSANFGEDSRSRGVMKSIPRGIEEWKKVRDLEDRGTRNSSCHPYPLTIESCMRDYFWRAATFVVGHLSTILLQMSAWCCKTRNPFGNWRNWGDKLGFEFIIMASPTFDCQCYS